MRKLKIEVKFDNLEDNVVCLPLSDTSSVYVLKSNWIEIEGEDDGWEETPLGTIISDDPLFKSKVESHEFDLIDMNRYESDYGITYQTVPSKQIEEFIEDKTNNFSSVSFYLRHYDRVKIILDEDVLLDFERD